MFYFLTHVIDSKLAGLELAIINRLKVFNYLNEPAKLVTFQYNRFQHLNLKKFGIKETNFLNLFDYFQEAAGLTDLNDPQNDLSTILKQLQAQFGVLQINKNQRTMLIFHQHQKVAEIDLFADSHERVSNVRFYVQEDFLLKEDGYDSRGFLSITSYFGQNGGVSSEDFYNVSGQVVGTFYYHEKGPGDVIDNTLITIKYKGQSYNFFSLIDLTAFFYDLLVQQVTSPVLIADRSYRVDPALIKMKQAVPVYEYWHNTFSSTNDNNGELFAVMQTELSQLRNLKGYLLPTVAAKEALQDRLPRKYVVENITVALNEHKAHHPASTYDPHKLVMVARIDRQKQIDQAIRAFAVIHKNIPTATLDIYGYIFDLEYNEELLQLTRDLQVDQAVHFEFYQTDIEKIYQNAAAMLLTSRNEGWGMVVNESLSYGVPVISYDTCYGPGEIISEGIDGYLLPQGDYQKLAYQAINLLENPELRQRFSENAVKNMERYRIEQVGQAWQKVIEQIKEG